MHKSDILVTNARLASLANTLNILGVALRVEWRFARFAYNAGLMDEGCMEDRI